MKTNLFLVALALAAGFAAPSWANEEKGDCSKNDGICGCSYGRVLCCDGSYAPRHYHADSGQIVYNGCTNPVNTSTLANQLGQPIPAYHRTPTNTRPLSPSEEIYWRGSIFDR